MIPPASRWPLKSAFTSCRSAKTFSDVRPACAPASDNNGRVPTEGWCRGDRCGPPHGNVVVVGATLVVAPLQDTTNGATTRVAPTVAMLEDAACATPPTLWLGRCSNPIRLAEAIDQNQDRALEPGGVHRLRWGWISRSRHGGCDFGGPRGRSLGSRPVFTNRSDTVIKPKRWKNDVGRPLWSPPHGHAVVVGATLVVPPTRPCCGCRGDPCGRPVAGYDEWGDHKGRPYAAMLWCGVAPTAGDVQGATGDVVGQRGDIVRQRRDVVGATLVVAQFGGRPICAPHASGQAQPWFRRSGYSLPRNALGLHRRNAGMHRAVNIELKYRPY